MKTLPSVLLLATVLGLSHCMNKIVPPDETLPEATQTGRNTAGCRVDGLSWKPYMDSIFGPAAVSATWSKAPSTGLYVLKLHFIKSIEGPQVHDRTTLRFFVPDVRAAGTFVFDQPANPLLYNTNPAYAVFNFSRPTPNLELLTGPLATGRLVITRLDTVARIVAGTFEFTAREANGAATVQVREGRFDCTF